MGCQESCSQKNAFDQTLDSNDESEQSSTVNQFQSKTKKSPNSKQKIYKVNINNNKNGRNGKIITLIDQNEQKEKKNRITFSCTSNQVRDKEYDSKKKQIEVEGTSSRQQESERSEILQLVQYDTIHQNDKQEQTKNLKQKLTQVKEDNNLHKIEIEELKLQIQRSSDNQPQFQPQFIVERNPKGQKNSTTSPAFFNNMPLYNEFQSKLRSPEIQQRTSLRKSLYNESPDRQSNMLGLAQISHSWLSPQLQKNVQKEQFVDHLQSSSKVCKEQEEEKEEKKVAQYEEVKEYQKVVNLENIDLSAVHSINEIVGQLKSMVGNTNTNRRASVEKSQDKVSSSTNNAVPQPGTNTNQNKNGTTVEITQQERTMIKEYYYNNGEESSPMNHRDQQSVSQEIISPKTNGQSPNDHDGNPQDKNLKVKRRKSKKKKKVIETTKTTRFLIHAVPLDEKFRTQNIENKEDENVSQNALNQFQSEEQRNDISIEGQDLEPQSFQNFSKTQKVGKSGSRPRSPIRNKDKKKKLKNKNLNIAQLGLQTETNVNLTQFKLENLNSDQEFQHMKDFESKWKQRRLQYALNLQKNISQHLKTNNHNLDASVKSIHSMHRNKSALSNRRMSLDKQIFVSEGRGRIEQKYDFLEQLGQGGFGLVRKVRHKITGEMRAMKIIQLDILDPLSQKNISNEVEILKQLVFIIIFLLIQDHPNIVKIYEFYQDKKNLYLIQEYIGGGDLFEKIKNSKGGFEENIASLIMKQILSAVLYCHNKGIVHRDLKPENILMEDFNNYGTLKIIDFGTSRNFQNSKNQKMNQKFGTAYYIAPEVLKKNYDEKCDIWSCGIILHILLCGYPPFRGKNEKEILEKVEIGYFPLNGPEWKSVTREAKLLLKQMLTYNSKERISAEQALNHIWFQIQTKTEIVTFQEVQQALFALRNFQIEIKLQQAACLYIASQLLSQKEIIKFKDIFNCFDLNGNGSISIEELREILMQHMNISKDRAHKEADRILKNLDINQNGAVDFTEFVIANVSAKEILTDDKLLNAFNMLDMDGNGRITKEDLELVFKNSPDINETILSEMIIEADQKGSGDISFNEFKELMLKLQKNEPYYPSVVISESVIQKMQ